MSQWYYRTRDGEVGPLKPSDLLKHVATGEILPHTLVRKGDSQWVEANQVGGLFDAAATGGTTFQCPFCGSKIDKPPTRCANCSRAVETAYRKREQQSGPEQDPEAIAEQRLEELRRRAQRNDIIAYAVILVLLIGVAVAAPWLYQAAAEGRLPVNRVTMSGIIAGIVGVLVIVAIIIGRGRD